MPWNLDNLEQVKACTRPDSSPQFNTTPVCPGMPSFLER